MSYLSHEWTLSQRLYTSSICVLAQGTPEPSFTTIWDELQLKERYWSATDRQTDRQTDRHGVFIELLAAAENYTDVYIKIK